MMKKKAILRGLLGIPMGLALGYVITVLLSLGWGKGEYIVCVPELADLVGNTANAAALQALLCGIMGFAFGAASVIWEMEQWSIVRQTGSYFFIVSVVMLPIAYLLYWMEHTAVGVLKYFGIFALIFVLVWMGQYWKIRNSIGRMNRKVE